MSDRLQQKLQFLYGLRLHAARTHERTLEEIRTDYKILLDRLGNPHLNLPPAIHVAGTNGKGSTIAFLKAMYQAEGRRVHTYTSPHLVRFNERIVLAGQEIDDDNLEKLLDEVMRQTEGLALTFFEVATAMAFLSFTRTPADLCLIEVGMGGKMDCTNVIKRPAATIITRISKDHCQYLGDTIEEIAAEKAGIIKPGVPCIIGYQQDDAAVDQAMKVFERIARQLDTPLHRAGHEWSISKNASNSSNLMFRYGSLLNTYETPILVGAHQYENAGAALACSFALADTTHATDSFSIHHDARVKGLTQAIWPGRLQRLNPHPLCDFIPTDAELWLDGGHNDSAGQVLAQQALSWHGTDAKPLHVVMAMKCDKQADQFMAPLLPHLDSLTIIPLPGMAEQSHAPHDLVQIARNMNRALPVKIADTLEEALRQIPTGNPPARILLTGSLFLAGSVLAQTGPTPPATKSP